jgi:molybdate transport system regulatory protein
MKRNAGQVVYNKYKIKGRMWIAKGEETFLGYGRIVLLERIKEYGSITRAAKSMGMSYRHAWELVESMNRQASALLVETATGGKGGGGAVLTPMGEKAITVFWNIYNRFNRDMENQSKHLFGLYKRKKCLKR